MRIIPAALCGLAVLAFATPASAVSYVDGAVAALKADPVFVAPGTEGTNVDTPAVLRDQLNEGDHILVVMLPSSAKGEIGNDPVGFARQIDQALGGNHIIGLTVGDQAVAYSAALPAGEATDLMKRATSVSTTPSETLVTFIRNVHNWQRQHPEAVASQPPSKPGGFPWWGVGAFLGALIGLLIALIVQRRVASSDTEERPRLRSPNEVKDLLEQILQLRSQVNNQMVRSLITQIATDTEQYFERQRRFGGNLREDTATFQRHLQGLRDVLERYIDVQNNHRYFDNPLQLMGSGVDAFQGFAEMVLNSIKRGNRKALTEYHVNTDILQAQRYS